MRLAKFIRGLEYGLSTQVGCYIYEIKYYDECLYVWFKLAHTLVDKWTTSVY